MAAVTRPRRRPTAWIAPVAAMLVVGTIATLAVLSPGYDAQEAPRLETSVWVTRDGQYARVNTELGEIDTTRAVADPAGLVQSGARGLMFTQGYVQAWPLDGANPADLVSAGQQATTAISAAAKSTATPTGTSFVASAGSYVLYLAGTGEVYLGTMPDGKTKSASPRQINPFADVVMQEGQNPPRYVADAATVDADGTVTMYSAAEGGVRRFSANTGRFVGGVQTLPQAPDRGDGLEMTIADGRWVLFSPSAGKLWIDGRDARVDLSVAGDARLQTGTSSSLSVLIADSSGLVKVSLKDGAVTRVADAQGVPAAPTVVNGVTYAAWISTTAASLWSTTSGEKKQLAVDTQALGPKRSLSPVFRTNGDRAVLSETTTGLLWTVPGGKLIPLSDWNDPDQGEQKQGTVQVDDVIEQQPPVAAPDAFGVRRGAVVSLPLLLNDHDPNKKDVLTIDPASMTPLADSGFGTLSLINQDQEAVVTVNAAEGSSNFTYAVTDGYSDSAPTTVSLTVVPDDVNTAPEWCPMEGCTQTWPTPQVAPGGYASISALDGWVDAEGDAIFLVDARPDDPNAPISVIPTSDGHVVIRHTDPNAGEATIPVTITVSDSRGAETTKELDVHVTSTPALDVKPVAVSGGVNTPVRVAIADHVAGGSGSYRLVDATASLGREDAFTVSPSAANGSIELTATKPGRYAANYTVEDTMTLAQLTAVVRLTVPDATEALAVPPLTAFVRTGEDTTVDVLASANATQGRVLMVSSVSTTDSSLSASAVGGALVRVSATSTSAQPGRLGVANVTIADTAGNSATTQLTVFLLPSSHGVGPVAVPDTVSVRAGSQVDVPVLANDVSPRGERIMLHPNVEGSGTTGELAFASGSTLRYLAPQTPGVYVVHYSIFLETEPGRLDQGTLTVTVLPKGSNRPPQPPALTARVLSGHSVTIPLKLNGIDPDGDTVSLANVSQPDKGMGTVSISASGDAMVYRAPSERPASGDVTFTYTVADADGAEATGTVRVGVLDAGQADIAPVTYADYVSARLGSPTPVTVEPLLNDRDPLQGDLEVVKLVPNADRASAEYARLESLIDPTTSLKDGKVMLLPGDVEGPHSYTYTVQSSASNAEGLIVVGVSKSPAPESLTVSDTVVTVQSRGELAGGIDVVTGKVQWPTGDPSTLALKLWGDASAGFTTSGWTIKGELPKERTVVPFSLTGMDANGKPITTYGFLRIPAFDEMRLQAKPSASAITVGEEQTAQIPLTDVLDIGPSDQIELRQEDSFAVQRDNARCVPSGADTASYAAGREAPWRDTCSVAVRLVGQQTWSIVPIPIIIQPKDAQAILSPVSRTITPGQKDSVDLLADLVSWEGDRVGDAKKLAFTIAYSGTAFEVSQTGSKVDMQAKATSKPGTLETIKVSTDAYGGLTTTITLKVGAALDKLPKGATFTAQCDVSKGSPCVIPVVGLPSEFDPYAGTPGAGLHLASVGTGSSVVCSVATVTKASDTQVQASWTAGPRPVGGECVVDFTVADAQEGKGPGQVSIDVLGYPQTPASVTTSSYTGSSVTLSVAMGQSTQAHPAVTDFAVYEAGSRVSAECQPSGPATYMCVVGGLTNGETHTYTARAVNSVGESLDTTPVITWAYQAPTITTLTAEPVYDPVRTTVSQGVLKLTLEGGDDIAYYLVENNNTNIARAGEVSEGNTTLSVGNQILKVTPVSRFKPPTSSENTGASKTASVTVPGAPFYTGSASAPQDGTTATIASPALNTNYGSPAHEVWMAWSAGNPSCTMNAAGGVDVSGGDVKSSTTNVITGLTANTDYHVSVCGTNGDGAVMAAPGDLFTWVIVAAPPGPIVYNVKLDAQGTSSNKQYVLDGQPSITPMNRFSLVYWYNGAPGNGTLTLTPGVVQIIQVSYCLTRDHSKCGDKTTVANVAEFPPTSVTLSLTSPSTCAADPQATDVHTSVADADRDIAITTTGGVVTYTITWKNSYSKLHGTSLSKGYCPAPIVTPPPSPKPSPKPSPAPVGP